MDTTRHISLHAAFAHCAGTFSYWLWIILAVAFAVGCIVFIARIQRTTEVSGFVKLGLAFVCLAFIMVSIFGRPTNVAQNTSEAAAARGHYLGY